MKFENLSEKEKIEYFLNFTYDSNLDLLKKYISNSLVFDIINNSNTIVDDETIDLRQINISLNKELELAKSKLSGVDLEVCLVYIEVLKKSAEFWISSERGGNGVGYNFLNNTSSTSRKPIPKGTKILAADAMGASGGLIVGALSAPWTGVAAPVTFFGVVGASAAWSSGCAALGL